MILRFSPYEIDRHLSVPTDRPQHGDHNGGDRYQGQKVGPPRGDQTADEGGNEGETERADRR